MAAQATIADVHDTLLKIEQLLTKRNEQARKDAKEPAAKKVPGVLGTIQTQYHAFSQILHGDPLGGLRTLFESVKKHLEGLLPKTATTTKTGSFGPSVAAGTAKTVTQTSKLTQHLQQSVAQISRVTTQTTRTIATISGVGGVAGGAGGVGGEGGQGGSGGQGGQGGQGGVAAGIAAQTQYLQKSLAQISRVTTQTTSTIAKFSNTMRSTSQAATTTGEAAAGVGEVVGAAGGVAGAGAAAGEAGAAGGIAALASNPVGWVIAAVAAIVAVTAAMVLMPKIIQDFGESILDSNRKFAEASGQMAQVFAKWDVFKLKQNIRMGNALAPSAGDLEGSLEKLSVRLEPYIVGIFNVLNTTAARVTDFADIAVKYYEDHPVQMRLLLGFGADILDWLKTLGKTEKNEVPFDDWLQERKKEYQNRRDRRPPIGL